MEALLSPILSSIVNFLTPQVREQLGLMRGIDEQLDKLRLLLEAVQSVLGDAEQREERDPAVRSWLGSLKDAAYDAEDVLDEFNIEVLRKARIQDRMVSKVRDFFSSHNQLGFQLQMGRKVGAIVKRIEGIVDEMKKFSFAENRTTQTTHRPPTHSYVVEADVIGREADREEIVRSLLEHDCSENVMVVSIVGMGGLGKTTLAQMVYNDSRMVKHFQQLLVWVCVSDDFDIPKLTKAIIDSATGKECDISNMELLQRRLREVLGGKRYLLILDDVWNEDPEKWYSLKVLLDCGGEGSRILVTTRNEQVSRIMGSENSYPLSHLSDKDAWALFERRAFAMGTVQQPNLVEIGKKIVEKCGGLPLAVKTLGSLMCLKTEEKEWLSVLESGSWHTEVGKDGILPALRLSYNYLPPHLKRCFAFCAIFPKDDVMKKEVLIQLWMANGFIPIEEGMELGVKGHEIFNELVWRSFLQDVKTIKKEAHSRTKHGYRDTTTCKMHDLMHDLAQTITRNECFNVPSSGHSVQFVKGIRHLSTPDTYGRGIGNNLTSSTLHTLLSPGPWGLCIDADIVSRQKFLRVLTVGTYFWKNLPVPLENLKHLRYLDLSWTTVETLPEAITTLYCLQTLNLTACRKLRELPKGTRHLSGLRHLYLGMCERLEQTPAGMGQLSSLQTLTKFIVGGDPRSGRGLVELKNLNLGGELQLYNLKNVREARDAEEANLGSKRNLHSIVFNWGISERIEDGHGNEDSQEVLEALKPHVSIKRLAVVGYGGVQMPTWMRDPLLLRNLVEIYLKNCRQCIDVPPFAQLPSLEVVHLERMDAVKHISGSTVCSSRSHGAAQIFPSLKKLVLGDMQNLEGWWEEDPPVFPRLVELVIYGCPKLMTMPKVPSLTSLIVSNYSWGDGGTQAPLLISQEKGIFGHMESLENLKIVGCEELAQLLENEEETRGLKGSLAELRITRCNWLFPSSPLGLWKNLSSLRTLSIRDCDALVSWPEEEFRCLTSLKSLYISYCRDLGGASSPSSVGGLTPHLEHLILDNCDGMIELPKFPTSLRSLRIFECRNLRTLPEWLGCLTQLSSLMISGCLSITSLPQEVGRLASLATLYILNLKDLGSLPDGMEGLMALQHLQIGRCPRLKSLPEGLQQRLPHLKTLRIDDCPDLERRCKEGGEYWHLVANIPDRRIRLNSTCSKRIISTLLPCSSS